MVGTRLSLLLAVVFGAALCVPVWWVTTQVSRAEIPSHLVKELSNEPNFSWLFPSKLIILEDPIANPLVNSFAEELCGQLTAKLQEPAGSVAFDYSLRTSCAWEYRRNYSASDAGRLQTITDCTKGNIIGYGSAFTAYDGITHPPIATLNSPDPVFDKALISSVVSSLVASIRIPISEQTSVKLQSRYQITFTLLIEDPDINSVNWSTQSTLQALFERALGPLAAFGHFSVESQVLLFASTSHRAPRFDSTSGAYFYYTSDLPHFINANEWKIESTSSTGTTINFLLFVPAESHRPLQIRSAQSQSLSSASFIVPHWGGVTFLQPPFHEATRNGSFHLTEADIESALGNSLKQLRLLLGLPLSNALQPNGTELYYISSFEMDGLFRHATSSLLKKTHSTMQSFLKLVGDLKTIPISEDTLTDFGDVVINMRSAKQKAAESNWHDAVQMALAAHGTAERLFFNRDMIAMLYFPDEHVFAIYVPLFVPVSFPLISGIWQEYSRRRKRGHSS